MLNIIWTLFLLSFLISSSGNSQPTSHHEQGRCAGEKTPHLLGKEWATLSPMAWLSTLDSLNCLSQEQTSMTIFGCNTIRIRSGYFLKPDICNPLYTTSELLMYCLITCIFKVRQSTTWWRFPTSRAVTRLVRVIRGAVTTAIIAPCRNTRTTTPATSSAPGSATWRTWCLRATAVTHTGKLDKEDPTPADVTLCMVMIFNWNPRQ